MPNRSLSRSSLTTFEKYSSMLAGNTAFDPSSDFLLEEIVLSSSAASVTFSGLGAYTDYKHLQIRQVSRSDAAANDTPLIMSINGSELDRRHVLYGLDGTVVESFSAANGIISSVPAASQTANIFGASVIDLLDFSSTSKNKTVRAFHGSAGNATQFVALYSGLEVSLSATTSIGFAPSAGNFIAGSRFSLYGSKG